MRQPQPASLFDTRDEGTEERALDAAEVDLEAGRVVSHAETRDWLADLAAGRRRPRPQPWK